MWLGMPMDHQGDETVADLQSRCISRGLAHRLDHERDGALVAVVVGDGERDPLACSLAMTMTN